MAAIPQAPHPTALARKVLDLRTLSELLSAKPAEPLVKGWLDRGELGVLVGRHGGGKSLVALDLSCSAATGIPWLHQLPITTPGPVVYVVAEGRNSIAPRVQAWCRVRGAAPADLEDKLYFAVGLADLGSKEWVDALTTMVDALGPVLVVIDTLAQASPGRDENSARDMGLVLHAAQGLLLRTSRPTVILLHHHGKDQAKGARGSTSIPAAADVVLTVSGPARGLTLKTEKLRNHEAPEPVVVAIHGTPPTLAPKRWSLGEIIHAGLAALPNGLPQRERVTWAGIWAGAALPPWLPPAGGGDVRPSRNAVMNAFDGLVKAGNVTLTDGVYRLNPNTNRPPNVTFVQVASSTPNQGDPTASPSSPPIERGEGDAGRGDGSGRPVLEVVDPDAFEYLTDDDYPTDLMDAASTTVLLSTEVGE